MSGELWQAVASEKDRMAAETKLDSWLVKPTDGIFARMNRRVSIPISRQPSSSDHAQHGFTIYPGHESGSGTVLRLRRI